MAFSSTFCKLSNAKVAGNWVLKNCQVWRCKCKHNKQHGNDGKRCKGNFGVLAFVVLLVETESFPSVTNGRGNKKYCNVHPIGRFANNAVVGVEQHGN